MSIAAVSSLSLPYSLPISCTMVLLLSCFWCRISCRARSISWRHGRRKTAIFCQPFSSREHDSVKGRVRNDPITTSTASELLVAEDLNGYRGVDLSVLLRVL